MSLLKKVMFFVMAVYAAARFLGLAYMISTQPDRLPVAVYVAAGLSAAIGIFLLCKHILSKLRTREMELYYLVTGVVALFNLLYVKFASRIVATPIDFLVIGTMMDVVAAVAFIVLAEKERKYVRIPVRPEK